MPPLLWGAMSIAIMAMLVAIPIGLMTAVFLSQYALLRVRGVVKPIIEVLAGSSTGSSPWSPSGPCCATSGRRSA